MCVLRLVPLSFALLLTACTTPQFPELLASADQMAAAADFEASYIAGGAFKLRSYAKIKDPAQPLRIYLEGDGKSFVNRYRPSLNPTPWNPLALELATLDNTAANILYLGRPCHFRPTFSDKICDPSRPVYWTLRRYSQEVVDSLDEALSRFKQQHAITKVELVGFSGGGTLALLLAAQRSDVLSVRTVAGNLDVKAFEQYHKVSPMEGSLNPLDVSAQLAELPQLHFSGAEDRAVPVSLLKNYLAKFTGNNCMQLRRINGVGHHDGWKAQWRTLLTEQPSCGK